MHVFRTVEHCYQYTRAYLYGFEEEAQEILEALTPQQAKSIGSRVRSALSEEVGSQWLVLADLVMESLALRKFRESPWREDLLRTGVAPLVEASRDSYWGAGRNLRELQQGAPVVGRNKLGEILMKTRDVLRNGRGAGRSVLLGETKTLQGWNSGVGRILPGWDIVKISGADTLKLLWVGRMMEPLAVQKWMLFLSKRDLVFELSANWNRGRPEGPLRTGNGNVKARVPFQWRTSWWNMARAWEETLSPTAKVVVVPYGPFGEDLEYAKVDRFRVKCNRFLDQYVPEAPVHQWRVLGGEELQEIEEQGCEDGGLERGLTSEALTRVIRLALAQL